MSKKLDSKTEQAVFSILSNAASAPSKTKDGKPIVKNNKLDEKTVQSLVSILMPKEESKIEEGGVKEWLGTQITMALASLKVPEDQWDTIEDNIYALALAGKLGDGTPSVETSTAILDVIVNLVGEPEVPLDEPELEPTEEPDVSPEEIDVAISDTDPEAIPSTDIDLEFSAPPPEDEDEDEGPEESQSFSCECLDCNYQMESDKHCRDIKCPECGGEMRRSERPGIGSRESFDRIIDKLKEDSDVDMAIAEICNINSKKKSGD